MRTLRTLAIAFAVSLPVAAQAADKLVTVTGQATIAVVPDSAAIHIGVSSRAKTAREASEANSRQMTAVMSAIKGDGIAERDLQTARLSLQPQYDTSKEGGGRLLGFQASNQLTVKVHDIGRLPLILDHAITAGATQMSGIEFQVSDSSKLLDKARGEAIEDAHRKAELYARAAGAKLGPVAAITEEGAPLQQPYMRAAAAGVPVAPGEMTLRASVTVAYELAP